MSSSVIDLRNDTNSLSKKASRAASVEGHRSILILCLSVRDVDWGTTFIVRHTET